MDEGKIKSAVMAAIEKSVDAHELAEVVRQFARGPRPTIPESMGDVGPTPGAKRLLTRIVLGDILDDSILAARPSDRTFPLRLFFGELSRLLAMDVEDGTREAGIGDAAFTLASGLNFFFRAAAMDAEGKMRVGLEVSRQLYSVAHLANLDRELVAKSAPLLATLMTNDLERLKFETVDHVKVFDSQLHERAKGSDPTAFNIVRPASFLCRVAANNAVKAKAEVYT